MYSFESRVRYSEINEDGKLSLHAAINYFQDCSFFQSELTTEGTSMAWLKEHNRAWLLSSWQIEVIRRPEYGEKITIATWPVSFRAMYGNRNFIICGEDHKPCIQAYSIWFYLNTETGRPQKVDPEVLEMYHTEPALPMEDAGRKLKVPEGGKKHSEIHVRRWMIDTNHHVNNSVYHQLASEWLPGDGQIKKLRIEYKKAARMGDTMIPLVNEAALETMVALTSADGEVFAAVQAVRE